VSPLLWFVASIAALMFGVGFFAGRSIGFDDGYDTGRGDRLDHELDAADRCRMLTIVEPSATLVDCVARGWVDR
jgi:hypothetical protein